MDDGGKENKEDNEFEAQRRDAIAEAGKGCTRKVFGGGTKPLLDKNVQAIMDKGFSLQVAENALRQNRNNVDRALRCLQVFFCIFFCFLYSISSITKCLKISIPYFL